MTAPPPTRPTRHRADPPLSQTVQRLLPPLVSVTAVVAVIVVLLVLNSRPGGGHAAGPAVVGPSPSASATPSMTPSSTSPSPSSHSAMAPPPVTQPPATQHPTAPTTAAAKPPVTVLNNSRRAGLAAHVAAELRSRGWPIRQTGNFTGRIAATTVYYPAGERAAAQRLAREFGQVRRVEPRFAGLPGSGLTLVVTRTWTG